MQCSSHIPKVQYRANLKGLAGNEARNPTAAAAYRACVRAALSAPGIERLIMDNRAIWKMKLDDQTARLESVLELNTQRVLLAIASRDGPYQSVLHPQVRETWKTEVCLYDFRCVDLVFIGSTSNTGVARIRDWPRSYSGSFRLLHASLYGV